MSDSGTQEILQRLTRIETKMDLLGNTKEVAIEALQSARLAHDRIDELSDNQKWLWRTVAGALIVSTIALLFKLKGV